MYTAGRKGRLALGAVAVGAALALSGCGSGDSLESGSGSGSSDGGGGETLVVGSQQYYSNEIVAEIYAQALENDGYSVERQFNIGQREVYLPELEDGNIDVFPEYIGSLLQAVDTEADVAGASSDDIYGMLQDALPEGIEVLEPSEAADENSWTVTQAFAEENDLTDIASLAKVSTPLTAGGNSELQTRPYSPTVLEEMYGIEFAGFTAIEDSGGPLTIQALVDDDIQLANVYTASPDIETNDLLALEDPDGLFVADNIAPVVSDKVDDDARAILDEVDAALTQEDFVDLNSQSVNDQRNAEDIATEWLEANDLL